jgi:hypothetical protein
MDCLMWLVLCDAGDTSALWVHQQLCARGLAPVELITADALAMADYWEHRIAGARTSIRFRIDNLDVTGDQLRGVVNRLYTAPIPHWRSAQQRDQDYVQQELIAFFLSWLHALPCPVINRPTPQGLSGRWRTESEWVLLAHQAGLPTAPFRHSSHDRVDEMKGEKRLVPWGTLVQTVIVLGDAVAGAAVPQPLVAACQRLAQLSGTELLGVDFIAGEADAWTFAGASPMPYLMLGGEALIDALFRELARADGAP